jgi:hypothetical protein
MFLVPITPIPNQSVAFNVDGAYWQVHIFQAKAFMCADISLNGEFVARGVRCFGGVPLMPYEYMHLPKYGNFVFDSDGDWQQFGESCNLYYLTANEWSEFKAKRNL